MILMSSTTPLNYHHIISQLNLKECNMYNAQVYYYNIKQLTLLVSVLS